MEVFNVNLLSTMRLLDYSKKAGVKKFVLASTGGIYGSSASPISVNSEILSPTGLGHYFGSKLSAEIFANNYKEFFAVDINRIFFMYGPRQSKKMLIPRLIDSVRNGLPVQLAGVDGISINPVYVQDVADFLHTQLCDLESHVYNIAGPEIVSIRHLTELISGKFGGSAKFEFLPKSANIVADATAFLDKLKNSPTKVSEGLNQF
jgi:nucleoside-diphosphate-sugar epimerase